MKSLPVSLLRARRFVLGVGFAGPIVGVCLLGSMTALAQALVDGSPVSVAAEAVAQPRVASTAATPVAAAQPVSTASTTWGQLTEVGKPGRAPERAGGSNAPAPDTSPLASSPESITEIELFVGESRVIAAPGVARIAVGNGQVLQASAIDQRDVLLFANAPGTSTLFVWNHKGQMARYKLHVAASDVARLAREVRAFLAPVAGIRVAPIGDKVVIEGDQLADADLARVEQLAQRYPQILNFTHRQGWEQMVMLDVKVVEFPVDELRELGLRWNALGGTTFGGVWSPLVRGDVPGLGLRGDAGAIDLAGAALPVAPQVRSLVNLGLSATLQAMAQSGRTTILAEPQLSARNGAKASFLAGGEFGFSTSNANGTTVQFKPYGVRLDIQPRVDRLGNVRASVETEFSQIEGVIGGIPNLMVRRTSTEFNVRAGETIVLSGLIQRQQLDTLEKVPLLGDVPVLGGLFRSKRFQNKETELVVFVTPTLVDANTPASSDRVAAARERLTDRLGPAPHLSGRAGEGR